MLWLALIAVALAAAAAALVAISVARAEQRARLTLLRALGVPDDAMDALMACKHDLPARLTHISRRDMTAADLGSAPQPGNPPIRLVHPTAEDAPPGDPASDRPAGWRSGQSR